MGQPVAIAKMQLDYIDRATEEGSGMRRKMGITGLWSWK